MQGVRTYAPIVMWPVAAVVGVIGYNLESIIRGDEGKSTPCKDISIAQERDERLLQEAKHMDATQVDSLKDRKFIPKDIFERTK